MIRPLLGILAVGYLVWRWTGPQRDRSGFPSHHGAARAVDTWEGEGGALPEQPAVPGQREHREVPA